MRTMSRQRRSTVSAPNRKDECSLPDSDGRFAFIAGYTEGGLPYGTTWDELREDVDIEDAALVDKNATNTTFREWVPDFDKWPGSWMGVREDLEYGRKMLPYFEHFLQELYDEGLSRKTFVQYRDHLWLLGGTIITGVSNYEEHQIDPLEKLHDSVMVDGILPDHHDHMSGAELKAFARMCRKLEKFLDQHYGSLF